MIPFNKVNNLLVFLLCVRINNYNLESVESQRRFFKCVNNFYVLTMAQIAILMRQVFIDLALIIINSDFLDSKLFKESFGERIDHLSFYLVKVVDKSIVASACFGTVFNEVFICP